MLVLLVLIDVFCSLHLDFAANNQVVFLLFFQQILLDLCSNSRDAMYEKGKLVIALRSVAITRGECSSCGQIISGNFVEIAVMDSGHGLSDEDIPRIFEPFYTTKTPGRGTGLGMSVLHGNVHIGGGHVIVESKKAVGTAVRALFLPAP